MSANFSAMLLRMKTINLLFLLALSIMVYPQSVATRLSNAFGQFEQDPQMVNGMASLYVVETKSGKVVFEKNGKIGLAPASTQKIITSVTAYELLGKDFRYKTEVGYLGTINNGTLNGPLLIKPSGDPTLGSWRWSSTKEDVVFKRISDALQRSGIRQYKGIAIDVEGWNSESIPDGWVWGDIGNYYGAGADAFNWHENQYDVQLRSGAVIGSPVSIVGTKPQLYQYHLRSELKAAAKGTGDNAYIYFTPGAEGVIRGTIPVEEKSFTISGAIPSPKLQFASSLEKMLTERGIKKEVAGSVFVERYESNVQTIHTEFSPTLDSIIYWFNKKSINLYGEALIKTIALQKKGKGDTEEGISVLKDFWKVRGVPVTELNMVDGSGLSPANRVTTKAQVTMLQYAQKQSWYRGFYYSLPEFNGMKMKSGTIGNVKGFAGYHTSKEGLTYIFSFLVNNYNGSANALVQKMYKVLDNLK